MLETIKEWWQGKEEGWWSLVHTNQHWYCCCCCKRLIKLLPVCLATIIVRLFLFFPHKFCDVVPNVTVLFLLLITIHGCRLLTEIKFWAKPKTNVRCIRHKIQKQMFRHKMQINDKLQRALIVGMAQNRIHFTQTIKKR